MVQRAFREAVRIVGIAKPASCHTFATDLLNRVLGGAEPAGPVVTVVAAVPAAARPATVSATRPALAG